MLQDQRLLMCLANDIIVLYFFLHIFSLNSV